MSNIYLNEFDRFVVHKLKPLAYIRYGDDWLCFSPNKAVAKELRHSSVEKLKELSLNVNPKLDHIVHAKKGISYLGVQIWPHGHRLLPSVAQRIYERLNEQNVASYRSLVVTHQKQKRLKQFNWQLLDRL